MPSFRSRLEQGAPCRIGGPPWWQATTFVGNGLAFVRQAPGPYMLLTTLYALPALLTSLLAWSVPEPRLWQQAILLALPWITIVLGAVVIMVAVGLQARGQRVDAGRATQVAVRWVPRYVWTNAHTSVIFWVPIGALLTLRQWQAATWPVSGHLEPAVDALWWLVLAGVALYLHTRTLLAPFLAVHADLPATLAALEAWRLGGRHLALCLATLVLGSLPVGVPLVLFGFVIARSVPDSARDALLAAGPALVWASIQALRPVLIGALYLLYRELWGAEQERRRRAGGRRVAGPVRVMLALTRRLPKLGRWD